MSCITDLIFFHFFRARHGTGRGPRDSQFRGQEVRLDNKSGEKMMTRYQTKAAWRKKRIAFSVAGVISVLCCALLLPRMALPVMAQDYCREQGMTVRNATMLDLWYKKNDGACSIWIHEHLFRIKQEESIKIFSDMNCQKLYCTSNPAYKDYQSADANGDCFVNIFPNCRISDK